MNKHQLTQDQIQTIAQCLSDGVEVPENLLKLLSPSYFEKLFRDYQIDYQKLEKYKIPTIEYAGKRSEALILSQAGAMGGGSPLQIERCFENNSQKSSQEASKDEWKNLIVQGDNLQFLKTCYLNQDPLIKDKVKGKVKLIYIDPPFGTGDEYGGKQGENSYSARIAGTEFMEALRERIIFLKSLLANDGFIFVRLDYHFGHYIKVLLDEIFDKNSLRNEFIVNRVKKNVTNKGRRTIPNAIDNIYCYSSSGESQFIYILRKLKSTREGYWHNMESGGFSGPRQVVINGQTYFPSQNSHFKYTQKQADEMIAAGKIRANPRSNKPEYWVEAKDFEELDSNWTDIPGYTFTTGYPTENSEDLLQRIVLLASEENDLVIDVFGGSGTTAVAAEKLNRKWILCDFGKHAIYTMQKRLLEIADSKKLGKDVKNGEKYGKQAKPFCVASVGAYDFQRIMNLRENKSAYIDFVLSLFGITDRAKIENGEYSDELSIKFKLSNIYAKKDNNPVEVYPIWDDDFLKNIKIDQEYLEGIITQVGGNMRGKYYIIAPETCDVIGDTTIGEAEFVVLSYPYKILEEMSRNFQLAEQPSSEENINDLISSVRFYFNEDIEVGLERVDDGLKITRLVTPILDKDGNHFEGFGGLAMLLVDKDYDGTTFRMEEAVYAKHINENGICKITGLSDKVAVIAIDKHGNESKLTTV